MKKTILSILIVLIIIPFISAQLTQCTPENQATRTIDGRTCILTCQSDGYYKDVPSFCCENGVEVTLVDGLSKYECINPLQENSGDSFGITVLIGIIILLLIILTIWIVKKNKRKVITQSK